MATRSLPIQEIRSIYRASYFEARNSTCKETEVWKQTWEKTRDQCHVRISLSPRTWGTVFRPYYWKVLFVIHRLQKQILGNTDKEAQKWHLDREVQWLEKNRKTFLSLFAVPSKIEEKALSINDYAGSTKFENTKWFKGVQKIINTVPRMFICDNLRCFFQRMELWYAEGERKERVFTPISREQKSGGMFAASLGHLFQKLELQEPSLKMSVLWLMTQSVYKYLLEPVSCIYMPSVCEGRKDFFPNVTYGYRMLTFSKERKGYSVDVVLRSSFCKQENNKQFVIPKLFMDMHVHLTMEKGKDMGFKITSKKLEKVCLSSGDYKVEFPLRFSIPDKMSFH
jgi:hypothetical protein